MGRRGPPKTPTGVKLAQGETRPSRVNFLEPAPQRTAPIMPRDMDDRAKAVWQRVLAEMATAEGIFAPTAMYCGATAKRSVSTSPQ